MRIAIGPVLYHWSRQQLDNFYALLAESPADIIYLGETVCSKRCEYRLEDWINTAQKLQAAGKQVVLSTLSLVEAESELSSLKRILDYSHYCIEANDMATVETLKEWGIPFVAGPTLNLYNGHSLMLLRECGMFRWVPPVELSGTDIRNILTHYRELSGEQDFEIEAWAFGRLPLAYSARCFTARALNLPKDQCQFRCIDYPEGLPVHTQDDELIFTINGTQTQSGRVQNLLGRLQELRDTSISVLRLSLHQAEQLSLLAPLARALEEGASPQLGLNTLASCDGYWTGQAGMLGPGEGGREPA